MTTKKLHTRIGLKPRRKKLRRSLTPAEAALWRALKGSQLSGRKFRRQHSVGKYILDFYCVKEWLAVELDGEVHRNDQAMVYDFERRIFLNSVGIKVIRFENFLVFDELEYVLRRIEGWFGWKDREQPPRPPKRRPPLLSRRGASDVKSPRFAETNTEHRTTSNEQPSTIN